jgi:endogenous inhibitor of DNA gyrase (YacG/DUF329 family)
MEHAAQECPACREKFVALRDALASRITPGPEFDSEAFDDWLVLNRRVLGDDSLVIAWAETSEFPDDLVTSPLDPFSSFRSELIELQRWDLAAKLIADPLSLSRERVHMAQRRDAMSRESGADFADDPQYLASIAKITRDDLTEFHGLALALGRASDARTIADEAIVYDGSDEMRVALVRAALRAGCAREMHRELLAACSTANPITTMQLDAALAQPAGD